MFALMKLLTISPLSGLWLTMYATAQLLNEPASAKSTILNGKGWSKVGKYLGKLSWFKSGKCEIHCLKSLRYSGARGLFQSWLIVGLASFGPNFAISWLSAKQTCCKSAFANRV